MKAIPAILLLFTACALPCAADKEAVTQGEGWRLIEGTRSRDGNFGIAWGIQGKAQPGGETDEEGFMSVDPESEGLTNYVVNLRSGTVVGKAAARHFGDKASYNHDSTEVAWSSSMCFVQVSSGKWVTYDANVYGMAGDQMSVSAAVDLLEPSKKAAFEHLAGGDLLEKFERDDFAVTLNDAHIDTGFTLTSNHGEAVHADGTRHVLGLFQYAKIGSKKFYVVNTWALEKTLPDNAAAIDAMMESIRHK